MSVVGGGRRRRSPDHLESWKTILLLAYQSLGVVYGDLSISPLYVYKSTFAEDITHSETNEEIFGVLSFVFWTLTLIPLCKYVFIVLRADDNGEGGTFVLYSLICRHANVSLLPNRQLADEEVSTYKLESPPETRRKPKVKAFLEKHKNLHTVLLIVVMLGTCMVIGDGVLTPAISVFSAVSGLELSMSKGHHEYAVVPITCVVLVCLFALQHYGTHRVGFIFAPIVVAWLLCISALGIYNIAHWNPQVYQALSPYYMYKFLKKTKKSGWMSLGDPPLHDGKCKLFVGIHANLIDGLQIAFTSLVYPALILAYMGQAAYLSKHHRIYSSYQIGFYVSVPESVRWPVLAIAILASVVGSQAIIIAQLLPRVKVVHTSDKIHGQIYIPEINWMLMLLCIAVAVGFRDTKHLGNASGLAVITVMLVTTCLTSLVMILCWHKPPLLALAFLLFFGSIEALFFSASLIKFREGAWLPILLALFLMTVMFVWHYATIKKYDFDLHNKVSLEWLLALGPSLGIARVPGIGLVYTDLISGVPANFSRFVTNLPAFHRVLVFVCVKAVPVPHVPAGERFLVGRDVDSFESQLVASLAAFIRIYARRSSASSSGRDDGGAAEGALAVVGSGLRIDESIHAASVSVGFSSEGGGGAKRVRFLLEGEDSGEEMDGAGAREELEELVAAREAGTAFILGHSHVKAKPGSSLLRKAAIDVAYNFLRRNCRGPTSLSACRRRPSSRSAWCTSSRLTYTSRGELQ
ncbi:unnamed protein product [Spirodela intermedia]|uniref:Potassium transporter n=1 Tax=Spirodela intermedia TaxID=51605 RepID=A0A7I8JGJ2_SPIIN|nr:unnamed protein product [Spirodela intermedia]CAA6669268.1 unnamed protein product [Spirodela intermedia]